MSDRLHASLRGGIDSSLIIFACLKVSTGFEVFTRAWTHRLPR